MTSGAHFGGSFNAKAEGKSTDVEALTVCKRCSVVSTVLSCLKDYATLPAIFFMTEDKSTSPRAPSTDPQPPCQVCRLCLTRIVSEVVK